jgi:hypothetical protein
MRSPSSAWQLKKTIEKSVRNSRIKRGHTENSRPNAQPNMGFRRRARSLSSEGANNAKSAFSGPLMQHCLEHLLRQIGLHEEAGTVRNIRHAAA